MRVALIARPDARERPGGDVAVAEATAAALRALGVDAELRTDTEPDTRGYDVAHVFGIFEPERQAAQIAAVRRRGTPLAISPIWWDRSALFALVRPLASALRTDDAARARRAMARLRDAERRIAPRAARRGERRSAEQRALLRQAGVAIVAGEVEAFACSALLGVPEIPYVVAPYGVERDAFGVPQAGVRRGVICVGRVEWLKNQAALLLALHDLDVDVTLVGRCYDPAYRALCARWATPRTRFVERVERAELLRLVASHTVHALPSFADLPGIVSLEAAALGLRVVAGSRGSEREYLGPDAAYVDPLDVAGIRDAVLRALALPPREPGDDLAWRVGALSWQRCAERTLEAYARAVARA